MRSAFDTGIGS